MPGWSGHIQDYGLQQQQLGGTRDHRFHQRRAGNAVASEAPAMQPLLQVGLLLLPDHYHGRGHLGKLLVFFLLLTVASGQLEISHGGLTVPNMLAKPASLYHRWELEIEVTKCVHQVQQHSGGEEGELQWSESQVQVHFLLR